MIQPTSQVTSYKPFRVSIIYSALLLICWVAFFIMAIQKCGTNCYGYDTFYSPCRVGGTLYCCSLFDSSAPYSCGYYSSCELDNTICGTYEMGAYVSGGLLLLGLLLMIVSACKFKKLKRQLLATNNLNQNQNQHYNNGSSPYLNNAPNPYVNNNTNPYVNQNQYYNNGVNPYVNQNQGNYAPPQYYQQN